MTSRYTKENSFIDMYVQTCDEAKMPLNATQIGLLEKTINEAFGVRNNSLSEVDQVDLFKPLDNNILFEVLSTKRSGSGRLYHTLEEYRSSQMSNMPDIPINEADAWSLYSLTAENIQTTTFKELKAEHQLPKIYGFNTFSILHEYFLKRGIVKESHVPYPKK